MSKKNYIVFGVIVVAAIALTLVGIFVGKAPAGTVDTTPTPTATEDANATPTAEPSATPIPSATIDLVNTPEPTPPVATPEVTPDTTPEPSETPDATPEPSETPAPVCAHEHTELVPGYAATCEEDGLADSIRCLDCGDIIEAGEVIPATGHVVVHTDAKEATCIEDGCTEGEYCEVCGKTLTEATVIPALGHDIVVVPGYEATHDTNGLTDGSYCARCGEVLSEQMIIYAEHQHIFEHRDAKDATCEEDGWTEGDYCVDCGHSENGRIIPALGHDIETLPAVEPNCKETGWTEGKVCKNCGFVIEEQKSIPALGHDVVLDKGYDATETATGLTDGSHCARCSEIIAEQRVIPVYKHEHTPVKDEGYYPTCVKDGLSDGYHCAVCGEVIQAQQVVKATGNHIFSEPVDNEKHKCTNCDATEYHQFMQYTENGVEWIRCTVCHYTEQVEKCTNHNFVFDYRHDGATSTDEGHGWTYDVYKCSKCGLIENREVEGHTQEEHNYTVFVEHRKATASACEGDIYACPICGATKLMNATHNWVTYQEGGDCSGHWERQECSKCRALRRIKDETGDCCENHRNEWVLYSTTKPTQYEEGVYAYHCICGSTKTEKIPKLEMHECDYDVKETTYMMGSVKVRNREYTCKICGANYSRYYVDDSKLCGTRGTNDLGYAVTSSNSNNNDEFGNTLEDERDITPNIYVYDTRTGISLEHHAIIKVTLPKNYVGGGDYHGVVATIYWKTRDGQLKSVVWDIENTVGSSIDYEWGIGLYIGEDGTNPYIKSKTWNNPEFDWETGAYLG